MKRLLTLLIFIPFMSFAQKDTNCTMDMYGCYVFTLKALVNGASGLQDLYKSGIKKKTKTIYIPKRFYTTALPDGINGLTIKYIDLDKEKATIYEEVKNNTAAIYYISELNVGAKQCDLWVMPVGLKKENGVVEAEYAELGSHLLFKVCGDNGKLGYDTTINPAQTK
jgi:hypothetical protein